MSAKQQGRPSATGGFSLGEILVVLVLVLAIIGGLLYFSVGSNSSDDGLGIKKMANAATAAACRTNLQTVRSAIVAARQKDSNGKSPASLNDLGLSSDAIKCPADGAPYDYNPETGEVHCTHPGHEKF